jgi:hypothetical protein
VVVAEVVAVKGVEGGRLGVDAEDVLSFLLLQVFLFGVLGPLAELLIVLHQSTDDLAWRQFLLHPGNVFGLQLLCLFQLENFPVVVRHLLFRFFFGFAEVPRYLLEFMVSHLQLGKEGVLRDLL